MNALSLTLEERKSIGNKLNLKRPITQGEARRMMEYIAYLESVLFEKQTGMGEGAVK